MFWMITWTTVQVIVGIIFLRYAVPNLIDDIKTGVDTEFTPEALALFAGSLGLIGGPIWIALNYYPEEHWWGLGILLMVMSGLAGWVLVFLCAFAIAILKFIVWLVTYPFPFAKANRERIKALRALQDYD